MCFSNGNIQWNISFTKLVQGWEVDLVTSFVLYQVETRRRG
jgi:hypothetical protein